MALKGHFKDISGQRFGRLTVLRFSRQANDRSSTWECACDCGATATVSGRALRSGHSRSCGCLKVDTTKARSTTHGHSVGGKRQTREYVSWSAMWARVNGTGGGTGRKAEYRDRGITACERWRSFECFLADMGPRPAGTTLDRKDNDGNYEPGNCRWATDGEQRRNKRSTRLVTWRGETLPLIDLTTRLGVNYYTAHKRLGRGLSVEDAVKPVAARIDTFIAEHAGARS